MDHNYVISLTDVVDGGDVHARSWSVDRETFEAWADYLTTSIGTPGYEILADATTARRVHDEQTKNAVEIEHH